MGVPVGIAPVALQQFFDVDGNPLAGGLLYTYASGTTTPLATYADFGGTTVNPNPLVLDSGGFASPGLFLQALAYTFVLTDVNNITQWSQDGIVSDQAIQNLKNPSVQVFAASDTFTVPTNVSGAKVTMVGGGGGGGGGTGATAAGGGGGAGATSVAWLSGLIPGNTLNVTVGTGGVGSSGANGGAGTASVVGAATANGGGGGTNGAGGGIPANGGSATGGDLNVQGGWGGWFQSSIGGHGGDSTFGGGGAGSIGNNTGNPGVAYGSGGGGGGGAGTNTAGGAGAPGIVIVEFLQ
jgi:hypothetical protein